MDKRSQSAPMHLLLGALFLLTLGQLLGLFIGGEPSEETASEAASFSEAEQPVETVTGTVIRREIPISGDPRGLVPIFADGTLVAAGQSLYREAGADADSYWVTALGAEYAALSLPRRREEMAELLTGDSLSADEAQRLTALLLAENETAEWNPGPEPEGHIQAPEKGLFCARTDGLEGVLTPEHPWPAYTLPMAPAEENAGKLVLSETWYFAAELSFCPEEGERYRVQVLTEEPFSAEFVTERAEPLGDRWRVLLSCEAGCAQIINFRKLSVNFLRQVQIRGGNHPGNLL